MAELNENELQNIASLEAELIAAQQLDIRVKSTAANNPIQHIVNNYAGKASLYEDPKQLEEMINALERAYKKYIEDANIQGRILGKKAISKFLDASERKDRTQRQLRLIGEANERQVKRRLDLALRELEKEANILKIDIDLFKRRAKIAGFSNKEILAQLVRAGGDAEGVVQGFAKRLKSTTVAAIRREKSASEIDEFLKVAEPGEEWVWVTVSTKPCPDCMERAGKILPLDRWQRMGLPGSGRTICGSFCRCKLMPAPIAEKRFPTVKEFNFDKDKLVLTTASEQRTLEAKKNRYKFMKGGNGAK